MADNKEYHENGSTEQTSVRYLADGRYEVTAGGGYDGYLCQHYETIEDALDAIAALWQRGNSWTEMQNSIPKI